jgi:hypothetical protein
MSALSFLRLIPLHGIVPQNQGPPVLAHFRESHCAIMELCTKKLRGNVIFFTSACGSDHRPPKSQECDARHTSSGQTAKRNDRTRLVTAFCLAFDIAVTPDA